MRFRMKPDSVPVTHEDNSNFAPADAEKNTETNYPSDAQSLDSDLPDKNAQPGLQKVEAVTAVWSRTSLVLAYVLYV